MIERSAVCACGRVRLRLAGVTLPKDIPAYPGFPPPLIVRLMLARLAMLFAPSWRA